jgi:membrane-associated phospholipid phosphatase
VSGCNTSQGKPLNFLIAYPSVAVAALLVPAIALHWSLVPADRKRTEWLLVAATLVIPLGAAAEAIADLLSRVRPLKYDLYVYRFDSFFGEPSFLLGKLVCHHSALKALVGVTYGILPMITLGVFALYLYCGEDPLRVVKTFVINFVAIVPLYLLFPVCGPAFAFSKFPDSPGAVSPYPILINAAPNGVPSGHTSSALLVLWLLWQWKWGRVFGVLFLALTVFATMGSGQHYFFDLLCALPYALAVGWLSLRSRAEAVIEEPFTTTVA